MPNNVFPITAPQRPDAQMLPPFMQGAQYSRDRSQYDQAMDLQQMMNQAGSRQTMATQPSQIQADIAKNQATAQTAIPEAQYKTEGLRLGNIETQGKISSANQEREIAKRKEAIDNMRRGVEMASVLRGVASQGNPAALASVRQRLGQGTDEVSQFIGQSTDNNDLMGRIDHVMNIYKKLNMDYQKALLDLQGRRITASTTQPNPWLEHVRLATRRLQRENPGMSEAQAQELASMEVRSLQSGEGGIRQPSPEQRGAGAAAEAVGRLEAQIGILPDGPAKDRIRANLERMKKDISEASTKAKPAASAPAPGAMPIEQARELLKRNNTPENRKYFEDTYKVKP